MNTTVESTHITDWNQLLAQQQEQELLALLSDAPVVEVADFLAQLTPAQSLAIPTSRDARRYIC